METTRETYTLRLHGPFALCGPDGTRIAVTSRRGMAMLAMLALAPGRERTRAWIVDKLWPTRGEQQGRSSLRQELATMRRLTSPHGPLLGADRERVWLEPGAVEVPRPAPGIAGEILEGLDIPAAEGFEDWLRACRTAGLDALLPATEAPSVPATPADAPTPPAAGERRAGPHAEPYVVEIVPPEGRMPADTGTGFATTLLAERLAEALREFGGLSVRVREPGPPPPAPPADLRLNCALLDDGSHGRVSLAAHRLADGAALLNLSQAVPSAGASGDGQIRALEDVASETAERLLATLASTGVGAGEPRLAAVRAAARGIHALFSREEDAAVRAERCFDEAAAAEPGAAVHAWQAYLAALLIEESPNGDHPDIRERAVEATCRSLEADPFNGLAAALLTHVHAFVLQDLDRAEMFLERARTLRPNLVMTCDAEALLNLYRGDIPTARQAADRTERLGRLLPHRYAFATTRAMVETVSGNFEAGLRLARRAEALQPPGPIRPYPPILRYKGICLAELGRTRDASETFGLLEAQEGPLRPGAIDPRSYPVPSNTAAELMRHSLRVIGRGGRTQNTIGRMTAPCESRDGRSYA
jgi:tetratricopeptide (TPR) repeat protein